jgi:boron transporter
VAGLLGLPFPNGLIPQAPFHTASLCVTRPLLPDELDEKEGAGGHVTTHVVEQRLSNLAQGLLTLATMSPPLLIVLHLIPQGVLAGLFFIMGFQALASNGITAKLLFLLRDAATLPSSGPMVPLRTIRRRKVWLFVGLELLGFGATFAITQTVAAVGFPLFILLLIPARAVLLPHWFTTRELGALDAPTASPFTMESVGGVYGAPEEGADEAGTGDEGGERRAQGFWSGERTAMPSEAASAMRSREELAERGEGGDAGVPSGRRGAEEELAGQSSGVSRRGQSIVYKT